jgi:pilus assembly protein CpaB
MKIKELFHQYRNSLPMLIVFLIGALLIHRGVNSYKKRLGLGSSLIEIVIAAENIQERKQLSKKDFQFQEMPSKFVPMGALRASDVSKIIGYSSKYSIPKGEMVLWSQINTRYNYQSPSTKIENGYRAISIPVDQTSSVSYQILPGDHVDILNTMEIPGENKQSTMTILQNVTVLTVGENSRDKNNNDSYASVTLMVLPTEANLITHGLKNGILSLVLRNPMDVKSVSDLEIVSDQEIIQTTFRNQLQSQRNTVSQK